MDNLVAIMSSDKGQAERLIATNAELVAINKAKDATITSLVAQNTNLMMIITKMSGGKTPTTDDLAGANGGGGHINQNGYQHKRRNPDDTPFDPNGYCWSHGYRVHFDHSSSTCKFKKAATKIMRQEKIIWEAARTTKIGSKSDGSNQGRHSKRRLF